MQLHAVAAGVVLTCELLTGDLSQVNYSSIRAGLMTLKESITRQGYDPAQVLAEIGVTNAEFDVLGIVLDTNPRWARKTGVTAASAERIGLSGDAEGVSPSKTAGSLSIDFCE